MDPFVKFVIEKVCITNVDIVPESNAQFNSFEQEVGEQDGLNSDIKFGHIVYKVNDETKKTSNLFMKTMLKYPLHPKFNVFNFNNESFFYKQILPFLSKLRPLEHLFPKFYACYTSISKQLESGVMIFQNLKSDGYVPPKKRSFLDYDHLSLMMRKLGEFHAYSYAYKNSGTELKREFVALSKSFIEIHFPVITGPFYQVLPKSSLRGLEELRRDGRTKYTERIGDLEKSFQSANEQCEEILTKYADDPLSVLCHGDYTTGNIMFKYENDKPVDMKMIDMANCRLASPVTDIAQVLYIHADQQMRNERWDDLLGEYFEAMKNTFPDEYFPSVEQISNTFKRDAKLAYFNASSYLLGFTLAIDNRLPIAELVPEEYRSTVYYAQRPWEVNLKFVLALGGDLCVLALGNILKDMIERGFI